MFGISLYFYKYKPEDTCKEILEKLLPLESAEVLLQNKKILECLDYLKSNNVIDGNV